MNSPIIDKIEKLLRLSKSDNQYEAELAAARASELMTKHQISMSAVDVERMRAGKIQESAYRGDVIRRKWVSALANACAELFDGMVVRNAATNTIYFVGFSEDNQAAENLFRHLYEAWFGIVKGDLLAAKDDSQYFCASSFRASHGAGYAAAITRRAEQLVAERKQTVAATSQTGTDLVIIKSDALRRYNASQQWSTARPAQVTDKAGYRAGKIAGAGVALGGAIK